MICSYFLAFLCWLNEEELGGSMRITAIHRSDLDASDPNVGFLLGKEYLTFRRVDLGREFALSADDAYDYVLHGATSAAPRGYLADPVGTINVNVLATRTMLEHFRAGSRLKSFIYVSSGEIYGNPDSAHVPTPEEYLGTTDHLTPRSCYVESKRFTETLCWNYARQYQVPVQIIRPVQVFGPGFREHDSRVWVDFIVNACHGRDIEILSDGTARRGFCYQADAVTQLLAVIQRGELSGVYNIGNDEHISIRELAEIVAGLSPHPVRVNVQNNLPGYLQGSPQISCPSIGKVRALSPLLKTGMAEGLKKSFDWFCTTTSG
jgi:nucleoside-diphosphate-sugar epimerase